MIDEEQVRHGRQDRRHAGAAVLSHSPTRRAYVPTGPGPAAVAVFGGSMFTPKPGAISATERPMAW
jgi:hypothetical protein